MSTVETPSQRSIDRAARKEQAAKDKEAAKVQADKIAALERKFLNREAIEQWAKMLDVPLVLDREGQPVVGFHVDPEMLERFNVELVAAMRDKIDDHSGKVRQGKVNDGATRFTLS